MDRNSLKTSTLLLIVANALLITSVTSTSYLRRDGDVRKLKAGKFCVGRKHLLPDKKGYLVDQLRWAGRVVDARLDTYLCDPTPLPLLSSQVPVCISTISTSATNFPQVRGA